MLLHINLAAVSECLTRYERYIKKITVTSEKHLPGLLKLLGLEQGYTYKKYDFIVSDLDVFLNLVLE